MSNLTDKVVNRIVVASVVIGFLTLIAVGITGVYTMQRNLSYTDWVSHTYQVKNALADYQILNERVETARRGYLISHEDRFYQTFMTAMAELPAAVDRVAKLTADNPVQRANIAQIRGLMAEQRAALEESVRAARAGGPQTGSAFDLERGVVATRALRQLSARMSAEEGAKLAQREADRAASIRNLTIVTLVGGLLLIVVGIGSIWVILGFTRDLSRSRDELRRMNAGLEGAVRERTSDLQRANDEIQRFAYIVSHDLRSPLVNVMGFTAELEAAIRPLGDLLERAKAEAPGIVTPDARAAVETDLPEAVNFIRTSTQKMDRLINAILQLSRQGRRVLAPEPLAMSRLLAGVVDNLKHRTEELGAQIVIEPGVPGLISDRLAVEQIFSNLVENALKYLSPARPGRIVLRGRHEGARVIYEVVDNGRGVDPKDHERIFDLFRRAGHQDQPGEGIGLAHVRALAYRLGGTVGMQSALDQGATFRVSLPAAMSVEGVA